MKTAVHFQHIRLVLIHHNLNPLLPPHQWILSFQMDACLNRFWFMYLSLTWPWIKESLLRWLTGTSVLWYTTVWITKNSTLAFQIEKLTRFCPNFVCPRVVDKSRVFTGIRICRILCVDFVIETTNWVFPKLNLSWQIWIICLIGQILSKLKIP